MKSTDHNLTVKASSVTDGAAVYSRAFLSVYDLYVLGFSNTFVWQCPSPLILAFYNKHVSGKHLDVGVGTGFFLDKCQFPVAHPTLALADLNPNSLRAAADRLQRYQPRTYIANVLRPLQVETEFQSISINYLLHCLPGNLLSKAVVFRNLKPLLDKNGGVIFGTTILGIGVKQNMLAKMLMRAYNSKKIFGNTDDHAADLERVLKENFRDYSMQVVGCVAFFEGRI